MTIFLRISTKLFLGRAQIRSSSLDPLSRHCRKRQERVIKLVATLRVMSAGFRTQADCINVGGFAEHGDGWPPIALCCSLTAGDLLISFGRDGGCNAIQELFSKSLPNFV